MLNSLRNILQEVNSASDFASLLEIIVTRVKTVMATGICSVYLLDAKRQAYVLAATDGLLPEAVGKVSMTNEQGLVGLVAHKAEPLNLEHAETHPRFAYFPETGEEKFSAFLGSPIIHHRAVLGVLVVQQQQRRRFDESEEAFLVTIAAQLAGIIAHAEATGELARALSPELEPDNAFGEAHYSGLASAPGIGIGVGIVVAPAANLSAVPKRLTDDIDAELAQFRDALDSTIKDLKTVHQDLADKLNPEEIALFEVYVSMLDDNSLGGEVSERIKTGLSAQYAWSRVILEHIRTFSAMENPYLRERATDVRDLGRRVLGYLQQQQHEEKHYPENTILVGEELAAPNLADVPFENIRAMVSAKGSYNSHMAILGRAMGIPTIMGAIDLPWAELDGCELIVDAHQGLVIKSPTDQHLEAYEKVYAEEKIFAADLEATKDEPSTTLDGQHISLWVNTGLRIDSMLSLDRGAEGVGLYRTEIPFFMRERFPSEEEQRQLYREQLEMFSPRPVTMRTLDIGGDKSLPYFPIEEENPFLGWRGIRVTLDHPEIFLVQLRAMMRASIGLNNLRILLPMISNTEELDSALVLIKRVYQELTLEEGYRFDMPAIGAMIEVPAAVYQIGEIAKRVDFISVGTNDLTQYLLAVDRNNPRVAELYHTFHPSLLKALRIILDDAKKHHCPVSVCGELAGEPLGAILLVGMGYEFLSMSAASLLRVKAILRQLKLSDMREFAEQASLLTDTFAIEDYLNGVLKQPEIVRLIRPASSPSLL
ncbi:MAG: phosphoenolpyruvate--protein phosphotransferase [Gammaproteobacteria bacterium]|nr:phosphoenolpyruvate--protein phosphotransferase [Gammaproteobacteria bacterium]MBQ0839191.1 phosphoenolpyruvate--protein phosphotransferase [Gammaproteobacteria bacterium]